MNQRRRMEVARLRAEGAQAYRDGKHIQTCPYRTTSMDHYQWVRGYEDERDEDIRLCFFASEEEAFYHDINEDPLDD